MKYAIAALLLLSSCATNDISSKLEHLHIATESVVRATMPIIDGACRQAAEDCADAGDEVCPQLQACDEFRRNFARSVIALYRALVVADAALAVGDTEAALRAIEVATEHMRKLREDMKHVGLDK